MSLAENDVRPLLRGRFGTPYLHVHSTSSTQDLLRRADLPEGAVAVADHQTAGRGRLGRTWDDQPGAALLVSVLLRPPRTDQLPQLSLVAGLATAEAIEAECETVTGVKWPNDILVGGKKVAGILLETDGDAVICGIGINVAQDTASLPPETRWPATSLRLATGRAPDRAALLAALLETLERRYDTWRTGGLAPLVPELELRNALAGSRARAGSIEGAVGEIATDGRLTLTDDNGATHLVLSGELELLSRPATGTPL
jgi:BirA family biotin operon repressor/biotin-[acetyl-CoA-carboxylase] ligase